MKMKKYYYKNHIDLNVHFKSFNEFFKMYSKINKQVDQDEFLESLSHELERLIKIKEIVLETIELRKGGVVLTCNIKQIHLNEWNVVVKF